MTDESITTRTQVRLTKRDLTTESGVALLQRLEQVWIDGVISERDVTALAEWLNDAAPVAGLPGLHFLREEIAGILADGIISEPEKRLLRDAILRVLPVAERERARARFAESAAHAREIRKRESEAEADRATPAQLQYISALGGACPDGTSKAEASGMIDALLASRPTVRQRMVLRFWNRLDLLTAGVDGVSAWLDEWYAEDPDRSEAWALWKREAGDQGQRTSHVVDQVPLGGGDTYLARVKSTRTDEARSRGTRPNRDSRLDQDGPHVGWSPLLLVCLGAAVLIGIALLLIR